MPRKEPATALSSTGMGEKSAPRMNSAGRVKATPDAALFTPEATVWLMLFSTMEPRRRSPRNTAKPRMAATVEPGRVKPSLSAT